MLRFVSFPIRPALSGVACASLSVQVWPSAADKAQWQADAKQADLFGLPKPERVALHPLGGRRFPVERFWFWANRASKTGSPGVNFRAANTDGFKSKPVAVVGAVGSA